MLLWAEQKSKGKTTTTTPSPNEDEEGSSSSDSEIALSPTLPKDESRFGILTVFKKIQLITSQVRQIRAG